MGHNVPLTILQKELYPVKEFPICLFMSFDREHEKLSKEILSFFNGHPRAVLEDNTKRGFSYLAFFKNQFDMRPLIIDILKESKMIIEGATWTESDRVVSSHELILMAKRVRDNSENYRFSR